MKYNTIARLWETISSAGYCGWSAGETFEYKEIALKCSTGMEFAVSRNGATFDSWSIRLFTKENFVKHIECALIANEQQLLNWEYMEVTP